MKLIKNFLRLLWRIWFVVWVIGTIVLPIPILFILLSNEKYYSIFYKIARAWAKTVLFVMGFRYQIVEGSYLIDSDKSYMFIANHTSMIDIMVMLAISKNPFIFVGKKELKKIPLFGSVFKRGAIMVDRSNPESRREAFNEADRRLKNGTSICIFPEGLVPEDKTEILSEFKSGAFRLAIEHNCAIIPITMFDCKRYFPFDYFNGSPGKLRIKIHKPVKTLGLVDTEAQKLKEKCYQIIYKELTHDKRYISSCKN